MEVTWPITKEPINQVLILIIMEDTHGEEQKTTNRTTEEQVLILIIMEDTHGETDDKSGYMAYYQS